MKPRTRWLILGGVGVAAALIIVLGWNRTAQAQHFTAKVERGDIHDVVEATGTINAVITVQVGSQVSGTISKLYVDFNSRVHKGDLVALIDPSLFQGAVQQANADLENAKANLMAARTSVDKAQAARVQTKADYDRTLELSKEGVMSQQQLDLAKANYDSAVAGVGGAQANVTQAEAQVTQKKAALDVAQTNLNYTVIRSPIDGTVVARNVDVGQTVAASLQAPTIFTIAQDLTKMLVYAKTDESDVGNIKVGKPVTFKVDAFPKETFTGKVSQVRMNATTVQNVVTYDTIIEFANPDLKLFPGMTAYVTIPVDTARNVLKLPNTALRYKPPLPPEEILAMYKQFGIESERRKASEDPAAGDGGQGGGGANQPRTPKADSAVVWKLHADNTMEPVKVSLGITDHSYTEVAAVAKGELKEGDELIIRSVVAKSSAPGTQGDSKIATSSSTSMPTTKQTTNPGAQVGMSANGDAVIRVEDIHKYYELGETRVHAVRGVNVDVHRGEFVAVMGASGSGKSTFMNILGCLDRPSSGRYLLESVDVSQHDKRALALIRNQKIGFVFQGFNLLARTTALENVELPTLYSKVSKEEQHTRAAEALAIVGLADRAEHFPSQMSGGQQQRVAVARALVNRPSILLADEPTGNLDSRTSVEIMEVFQNLNDKGLTIVMVTHEHDIAEFAKRVLVFRDGRIRKDEPVRNRPRAAEVLKTLPTLED